MSADITVSYNVIRTSAVNLPSLSTYIHAQCHHNNIKRDGGMTNGTRKIASTVDAINYCETCGDK